MKIFFVEHESLSTFVVGTPGWFSSIDLVRDLTHPVCGLWLLPGNQMKIFTMVMHSTYSQVYKETNWQPVDGTDSMELEKNQHSFTFILMKTQNTAANALVHRS